MQPTPTKRYTATITACPVCGLDIKGTFTARIETSLGDPSEDRKSVDVTVRAVVEKVAVSHDCDLARAAAGVDVVIGPLLAC